MTVTAERITDESEVPDDVTEIIKMEVDRVDGVLRPANGAPFLFMKQIGNTDQTSMNEAMLGKPKPDTPLSEMCPSCGQVIAGPGMAKSEHDPVQCGEDAFFGALAKAHRDFDMDTRRSLASKGQALEDGSYPMPDADAVRRAAILIRSGHGNVSAARALLAKRVRELGIPNPLEKKAKMKMAKAAQTPPADDNDVPEGYIAADEVDHLIKAAVTEASTAQKAELDALRADLAKVLDQPRSGGPVTAAPGGSAPRIGSTDGLLAKARGYRQFANTLIDPVQRSGYLDLAREAEEEAATAAAASR